MTDGKKGWAIGLSVFLAMTVLTGAVLQQVNTTSVQTLSNKTYANPIFSGTATGTYTLGGTPTISSPAISSPTFSGTASGSLTSLTLITPVLGTPTSGTLTNATGLPVSTGISGLGAGVATFLGTPSSANFFSAVTGETGSGAVVGGTNPTIDGPTFSNTLAGTYTIGGTPTLGAALAGGGNDVTGLDEIGLNDASANATAAGRLRRNATALTWHDGTAAQVLLTQNQAVKNPIINGNMEVWQRGTTFTGIADNSYSADRLRWDQSGVGVLNIVRSTIVPSVGQAGVLFNYSLHAEVTTADASIAAADIYALSHRIEGYNWRPFAQRDFTLSFWVLTSKAGQHAVAFRNSVADRSYVGTYTVSSPGSWEYKTITVPASPSAGTWDYTSGIGLEIAWVLEAGSTYHTTAGSWQTGNFYSTSAQADLLDTIGNDFLITGIKLELGSIATPIQYVPFGEELARCQRYYQKSFNYSTAPADGLGSVGEYRWVTSFSGAITHTSPAIHLPGGRMRVTPSITLYATAGTAGQVYNVTDGASLSSSATFDSTEHSFHVQATGTAGTAVNERLSVLWAASSEL